VGNCTSVKNNESLNYKATSDSCMVCSNDK